MIESYIFIKNLLDRIFYNNDQGGLFWTLDLIIFLPISICVSEVCLEDAMYNRI